MRIRQTDLSFEAFVDARASSLLRTALLLTGQNKAEAEDLLQLALEKAYRHWARICRTGEPERYVRRILANASTDRWRRLSRYPEQSMAAGGWAEPVAPDHAVLIADRDYLLRALAALPPGHREEPGGSGPRQAAPGGCLPRRISGWCVTQPTCRQCS